MSSKPLEGSKLAKNRISLHAASLLQFTSAAVDYLNWDVTEAPERAKRAEGTLNRSEQKVTSKTSQQLVVTKTCMLLASRQNQHKIDLKVNGTLAHVIEASKGLHL